MEFVGPMLRTENPEIRKGRQLATMVQLIGEYRVPDRDPEGGFRR